MKGQAGDYVIWEWDVLSSHCNGLRIEKLVFFFSWIFRGEVFIGGLTEGAGRCLGLGGSQPRLCITIV